MDKEEQCFTSANYSKTGTVHNHPQTILSIVIEQWSENKTMGAIDKRRGVEVVYKTVYLDATFETPGDLTHLSYCRAFDEDESARKGTVLGKFSLGRLPFHFWAFLNVGLCYAKLW